MMFLFGNLFQSFLIYVDFLNSLFESSTLYLFPFIIVIQNFTLSITFPTFYFHLKPHWDLKSTHLFDSSVFQFVVFTHHFIVYTHQFVVFNHQLLVFTHQFDSNRSLIFWFYYYITPIPISIDCSLLVILIIYSHQ